MVEFNKGNPPPPPTNTPLFLCTPLFYTLVPFIPFNHIHHHRTLHNAHAYHPVVLRSARQTVALGLLMPASLPRLVSPLCEYDKALFSQRFFGLG